MTLASFGAAPIVEFFDDIAPDYERWAVRIQAKAATRLAALVEPHPEDRCLDIGCGTGLVTREIAKLVGGGAHLIGIDPAPKMLREARRRAPAGARYQAMWAEDLVFRDGAFDIVTFGDSLTYLADPFRALEEAHRVLRPGGRIGVSCQTPGLSTPAQDLSLAALLAMAEDDGIQVPRRPEHHEQLGDPAVLVELLDEYGFREPRTTQMMTGFRARNAVQWVGMLAALGPVTHSIIASMGSVRRARLAAALKPEMRRLGEDAWRMHHSYTLVVAVR